MRRYKTQAALLIMLAGLCSVSMYYSKKNRFLLADPGHVHLKYADIQSVHGETRRIHSQVQHIESNFDPSGEGERHQVNGPMTYYIYGTAIIFFGQSNIFPKLLTI